MTAEPHGILLIHTELSLARSVGELALPLYRMLRENTSFDPEEVKIIAGAYEDALWILQLSEEDLRKRELLAAQIMAIAAGGERSRLSLCERGIMYVRSRQ